jgi:hypothetical protein
MRPILFLLLLLSFLHSSGQVKHSRKFKHVFALAEKNFDFGYYNDALVNYMKIYKEDTNDIQLNYKIALCHYNEEHHPDSIIPFLLHDDASDLPEVQFLLGKLFHLKHNFKQAEKHYLRYKTFSPDKREVNDAEIERLIEISRRADEAMKHPHKGVIVNLGQKINSKFNDYVPLITPDESIMFFTSRRPGGTGNLRDEKGNYYEDIYFSKKVSSGWTEPVNLGSPVNSNDHDACVGIAPDGKGILLYRPSKDKQSGDIYETRLQNEKWGLPVKLDDHINTTDGKETSACISLDGQFLYFSSDKPGGFGGKDIYRCTRLPNGKWGLPVNLGPVINTIYDEDAPFLSADDRVLYFSSKGHATIGEYDIFKSEFNTEENCWGLPENMGFPVNSVGNDIFFVMSADGYHGYYSSQKDNGYGGEDIYLIDMHYSENDVKIRSGYIFENGSQQSKPVKAKITLVDDETNQVLGYYTSNLRNGKFILMVSPFRTYSLNIEAEGYQPYNLQVDQLTPENEEKELKIELNKK